MKHLEIIKKLDKALVKEQEIHVNQFEKLKKRMLQLENENIALRNKSKLYKKINHELRFAFQKLNRDIKNSNKLIQGE